MVHEYDETMWIGFVWLLHPFSHHVWSWCISHWFFICMQKLEIKYSCFQNWLQSLVD